MPIMLDDVPPAPPITDEFIMPIELIGGAIIMFGFIVIDDLCRPSIPAKLMVDPFALCWTAA